MTPALKRKKVFIIGGGVLGCETALFLAEQGKSVTIAEMLSVVASEVPMISRVLETKLVDSGVEIRTNLKIIEITDDGVAAIKEDLNLVYIEADNVVLAMGLQSQTELYDELKGRIHEIYLAGDSVEPRRVGEATRDGYRIGCTI
jgi:2-enoate reductase